MLSGCLPRRGHRDDDLASDEEFLASEKGLSQRATEDEMQSRLRDLRAAISDAKVDW